MFLKYLSIKKQQEVTLKKYLGKVADNEAIESPAVQHYLSTALPDVKTLVDEVEYLALDFETTGLSAQHEAILSVGFTVVRQQKIMIKDSGHFIIKVNRPISDESIVIHKITEEHAAQGQHIHNVLEVLLDKMAGRVLLVHYAAIEKNFLNSICQQLFGITLPLLIVDTLSIEHNYLQRTNQSISQNQLRLFNLRKQYGLPRYKAHNALEDAIATAELFLAQMQSRQTVRSRSSLKDILL